MDRLATVMERLLTADEAAAILQVSRKTLYRLPIRYVHTGASRRPMRRYRREDLEHFIKSRAA